MSWIPFILASSVFNALWGALGRKRLGDLNSIPFGFIFRGFVVLFYLPLFLSSFRMPTSHLFWLAALASGLISAAVTVLLFEGIRDDFYPAYSLRHTTPIFTWVLAAVFLKETANAYVITGILLTVAGALLFHGAKQFSWYGLSCAVLSGIGSVFNKVGVDLSSPLTFPFVSFLISVLILGGLILAKGKEKSALVAMVGRWRDILPISCFSFLAILTGFTALKMAPVSWVVPVGRMRILFGFGLSYLYLHEKAGWRLRLLAGSVILAGTLLIVLQGRMG